MDFDLDVVGSNVEHFIFLRNENGLEIGLSEDPSLILSHHMATHNCL